MAEGTIKIKLVRSPICTPEKHKRVVKGLGLRKLNQSWSGPTRRCFAAWSRRSRICWKWWNRNSAENEIRRYELCSQD